MRQGAAAAALAGVLLVVCPAGLRAQTPEGAAPRPPVWPAVEAYDSYPSAGACVSVLQRHELRLDWYRVWSQGPYDPTRMADSSSRSAAARCLARVFPGGMTVAQAPDPSVPAVFAAARAFGDDSAAARAIARQLKQQRLRYDSASVYWSAMGAYTSGLPTRLATGQAVAARLDALGVVGERSALPQDSTWFGQHSQTLGLALAMMDTAAFRTELAGKQRNLAAVPAGAMHGTEYDAVTTQAMDLLLTLLRHSRADSAVAALKAKSIAVFGPNQEQSPYGGGLELLGQPFRTLHPDFWFNRSPADTVLPRKGRVTLVQFVSISQCGCEAMVGTARRLKQKFGDSLDLLFITQTQGHFDRQVQLEPAEEARQIGRRMVERDSFPGTIAVYRTTFVPNPDPDSRLVPQTIEEIQRIRFAGSALLIDRRGVFVLAGGISLDPYAERALNALVESLLRDPAT